MGDCGVESEAIQRYVQEQIYTLPGTARHREEFTILLTGSRALGCFSAESDVDIDVLCPRQVYDAVLRASLEKGIIKSDRSFFCLLGGDAWHRYFGAEKGRPHFSVTPLDSVQQHFRDYDDVKLWIWTTAQIISDPDDQFARIREAFGGYPKDVLVRKIKYHYLRSAYASVDIYPRHHQSDSDFLAAVSAVSGAISDLLRVFFLVEGRPFPYAEKLMHFAHTTALGREFGDVLEHAMDLVVGRVAPDHDPWQRLGRAVDIAELSDRNPDAVRLSQACSRAMIAAGVDVRWVQADYLNIDEFLSGELGPVLGVEGP